MSNQNTPSLPTCQFDHALVEFSDVKCGEAGVHRALRGATPPLPVGRGGRAVSRAPEPYLCVKMKTATAE